MLDHLGPDRSNPESRPIRLVDGLLIPMAEPDLGPSGGEDARSRRYKKDTKDKKDTKARKDRKDTKERQAKRDQKEDKRADLGAPGHTKKVKATKRLAAELQGLGGALMQLRNRFTDLHSVQLDQVESQAALSRRVETLDGLAATQRGRDERLVQRLDQVAAAVQALGARIDRGLPQSPALEGLAARLSRAESALTVLQDQPDPGETADRVLGDVEGRLAALRGLLDAQVGRLERLERDVQALPRTPAEAEEAPWRAPLEALSRDLDERLQSHQQGLTRELLRGRDEGRQGEEAMRAWTLEGLGRLGRRQALALGIFGVLVTALLATGWWRTDAQVAGSAERLGALEQRLAASAPPAPSSTATSPTAASPDLYDRLGRLEAGLLEGARDLAAVRQAGEGAADRLADLAGGQQALSQRLDALQRDIAEANKGLAVLGERLRGQIAAPQERVPVVPDAAVLREPAYAVQLVAYHGRGPIAPFVERFGVADQAKVAAIRINGRPAYAVLLGPYGSESEARAAIDELSPGLRSLGPWVRRLPAGTRLQPWD